MTGRINSLDVKRVSMKRYNKEHFTDLFTNEPETKAAVEKALNSKGVVYCLMNKDKQCVCLHSFYKIIDPEDKRQFRLIKDYTFCANGCAGQEAEFIEALKAEIQELICFTGVRSVDWDGAVTTADDIENNSPAFFGISSGAMVMLSILFAILDHPFIGGSFAVLALISLTSGAAVKIGQKKDNVILGSESGEESNS